MATSITSDSTVPSSPSAAVFSDELQRPSSPPSSPPGFPWEQLESSPHVTKLKSPIRTAFSVLGKRKALETIDDNARPKKKASAQPVKQPVQPLMQMQISLGQEVQKNCKTCGMEYVPSASEDKKLHDKYHKQNTEGFDLGKDFVQKARPGSTFEGVRKGDMICQLMCSDRPARKRRGQAALEVVQRELGAVEIPRRAIWDMRPVDPDYHAYLYIRGTKCIGFLLTQRIKEAYTVLEPVDCHIQPQNQQETAHKNSSSARHALKARQDAEFERREELSKHPIELSKDKKPAILGVSRIWTSATHRRQSIAKKLLVVAYADHNTQAEERARVRSKVRAQPGMLKGNYEQQEAHLTALWPAVPTLQSFDDVAFSQPTEAGTRLARKWFGKMFGWKVYVD